MVAIRGTNFPWLVHYTQNISLVDIRSISRSQTMMRLLRLDTPDTVGDR